MKPYVAEDFDRPDLERTKPSVLLFDWTGDDEVTVRWETVRRDRPPEPDPEDAPAAFRGIGPRAGGIALGMVLGISLAIGLLALFLPQAAPASPLTPSPPPWPMPMSGPVEPSEETPETTLASMPLATPEVRPLASILQPSAAATSQSHARRVRTLLNVDATEKANVILDGRPIGATPQRVPVNPGTHLVVFVHPTEGRRTLAVDAAKDRVSFATARF